MDIFHSLKVGGGGGARSRHGSYYSYGSVVSGQYVALLQPHPCRATYNEPQADYQSQSQ